MRRPVLLALALLLAVPARGEGLWEPLAGVDEVEEEIAEAKLHLARARARAGEWLEARAALLLFERAAAARPSADVHYWAVVAAGLLDRPEGHRAVIVHADAFRALAPADPRGGQVTWAAALARSKLGAALGPDQSRLLDEAVAEYDHYLRYHRGYDIVLSYLIPINYVSFDLATTLSNYGELLMAVGRLDDAIAAYRESIAAGTTSLRSLAYYGLAVALDRDGQERSAAAALDAALELDRDDQLHNESVFFVPDGDIHYYAALIALARGDTREARAELEAFLDSPGAWRYQARARERLERLAGEEQRRAGSP